MIKVGTTFSGIGAPEQALKNLKIPHVVQWACDIDKRAKETYFANHECEKWYDDITKINIDELEYVDLYVSGFPCQDISMNGKQNLELGRSILVKNSIEIINKIKPRYFLFENVKNILSKKYDPFLAFIKDSLSGEYNLHEQVLNSCNFGVPQNRERYFLLGVRKDIKQEFTFPIGQKTKKTISDITEHQNGGLPKTHKFYSYPYIQTKNYRQYDRSGKKYNSQADRVYCPEAILPTLTAYGGGIPHILLPNGDIRYATTIERCREQGFPDNFSFPVLSKQAWKQLGNSMTVPVLEAIFKELLKNEQN